MRRLEIVRTDHNDIDEHLSSASLKDRRRLGQAGGRAPGEHKQQTPLGSMAHLSMLLTRDRLLRKVLYQPILPLAAWPKSPDVSA